MHVEDTQDNLRANDRIEGPICKRDRLCNAHDIDIVPFFDTCLSPLFRRNGLVHECQQGVGP
jgi:hypothetical protein